MMASLTCGVARAQPELSGVELVAHSLLKLVLNADLDNENVLGPESRQLDRNGRLHSLCNSTALIFISLPLSYLSATFSSLELLVQDLPKELQPHVNSLHPVHMLTSSLLSPTLACSVGLDFKSGRLLALLHALLHHATFAHLSLLVAVLLRTHLAPLIVSEEQLLFLFAVFGPYMARVNSEPGNRQLCVDLATILYELLAKVDGYLIAKGQQIVNVNTVADFFYHLKYHYIGDAVRGRVENAIAQLQTPGLQHQLRFVVTSSQQAAAQQQQQQQQQQQHQQQLQQQQPSANTVKQQPQPQHPS